MFALTQRDVQTSNATVEGMITLSGYTARALFDPRATHSFISNAFANKLDKSPKSLQIQLIISAPLGTEIVARTIYKDCKIIVGGVRTRVDIIKLGEMEFDIILGIDWLSTYQASVDCSEKKVTLRVDGIPEFTIEGVQDVHGASIISALKALKLLR